MTPIIETLSNYKAPNVFFSVGCLQNAFGKRIINRGFLALSFVMSEPMHFILLLGYGQEYNVY